MMMAVLDTANTQVGSNTRCPCSAYDYLLRFTVRHVHSKTILPCILTCMFTFRCWHFVYGISINSLNEFYG